MIWQNPWAWLGIVGIGVPILLHLLGRRRPTPLPFPTLRFIRESRPSPTRRHRVNDIPLLLVRIAAIVSAVAALAQPLVLGPARAANAGVARVAVIDTSASMNATTANVRSGLDVARERAQAALIGAATSRTIDASNVRVGLETATAWLRHLSGTREIVVVSDFQRGAIDDAAIRAVGADIGLRFDAIETTASAEVAMPSQRWHAERLDVRAVATPESTTATWRTTPAPPAAARQVRVLPSPDADADVRASVAATRAVAVPEGSSHAVAVIFPAAHERASVVAGARAVDETWMFDVIEQLRHDAALVDVARAATLEDGVALPNVATPILRTGDDRIALAGLAATIEGASHLVLLPTFAAGQIAAAALVAGANRAAAEVPPVSEREPARISAATLATWTRPATPVATAPARDGSRSDGRWLWAVCLVLLGVETWMRRRPLAERATTSNTPEAPHARVA